MSNDHAKGNLLILDEPTNHIDQATKDSLRESLANFAGTVIVVSHEEGFIRIGSIV